MVVILLLMSALSLHEINSATVYQETGYFGTNGIDRVENVRHCLGLIANRHVVRKEML